MPAASKTTHATSSGLRTPAPRSAPKSSDSTTWTRRRLASRTRSPAISSTARLFISADTRIPARSRPKPASSANSVPSPSTPAASVGVSPRTARPATAPSMTTTTASKVDSRDSTRCPRTRTMSRNAR